MLFGQHQKQSSTYKTHDVDIRRIGVLGGKGPVYPDLAGVQSKRAKMRQKQPQSRRKESTTWGVRRADKDLLNSILANIQKAARNQRSMHLYVFHGEFRGGLR